MGKDRRSSVIEPPRDWVNPRSLLICRERMNLNPQQIEDLFAIPADKIINWENSAEIPRLSDIERLADIYRCPAGYFFIDNPPAPHDRVPVNYRGLSKGKIDKLSYKSRLKIEEFLSLTDLLSDITSELGTKQEVDIPIANLNDNIVGLAARELRAFGFTHFIRNGWESAEDAFNYWKQAIEKKGIYVISLRLEVSEVRGASRWDKESIPAILVNTNDAEAATGRTFTLVHEWAHLLLREPGIICDFIGSGEKAKVETFANKFAAEMLAPRIEIEQYLKAEGLYGFRDNWGDPTIVRIKDKFRVSRDVIAISLEDLGLAPAGFYQNKRIIWDERRLFYRPGKKSRAGRTKISLRFKELGLPFSNLIAQAYESNYLQPVDLARLLSTKVERIPEFLNLVVTSKEHPA